MAPYELHILFSLFSFLFLFSCPETFQHSSGAIGASVGVIGLCDHVTHRVTHHMTNQVTHLVHWAGSDFVLQQAAHVKFHLIFSWA